MGEPVVEVTTVATKVEPLFRSARVGDRVTILTPHGSRLSGRVVMRFETHLVLNGGGKHGTPLIADDRNTVSIRRSNR